MTSHLFHLAHCPVQVHREIQQRSPISGSRRQSLTSMLSNTLGNNGLIAAQVTCWKGTYSI